MGAWGAGIYDNDTALDLLSDVAEIGLPAVQEILAVCRDAWTDDDFSDSELEDGMAICGIVAGVLDAAAPGAAKTRETLSAEIQMTIRTMDRAPVLAVAKMVQMKAPELLPELDADQDFIADYMDELAAVVAILDTTGEAA